MNTISLEDYVTITQYDANIDLHDLQQQLDTYREAVTGWVMDACDAGFSNLDESSHEDWDQSSDIEDFLSEASGHDYAVHEDHMDEYARDFAEDMGMEVDRWPYTCIDWADAAEELRSDMTIATWGTQDFYLR